MRFNYDCTIEIRGTAPLTFGKPVGEAKLPNESHNEHDLRTWRQRLHTDGNGQTYIPAMAFKLSLAETAKHLGEKIPGKGRNQYGKHFDRGIMVGNPLLLFDDNGEPIMSEEVKENRLFVPSDGKKGGSTRVFKNFPEIPAGWTATATVTILDPVIQPEIVERYIEDQGVIMGLLVHRPQRGGNNGRFVVVSFEHTKTSETALAGSV